MRVPGSNTIPIDRGGEAKTVSKRSEQPGRGAPLARFRSDMKKRHPHPESAAPGGAESGPATADHDVEFESRIQKLPPEIGVLLIIVGILGLLLPGPVGSPFVLAGGLTLWPKGFGKVEVWFQRRFPGLHRAGVTQIDRFLVDLERRYPGSV